MNIAKCLRTPFFIEHHLWLLLFHACSFFLYPLKWVFRGFRKRPATWNGLQKHMDNFVCFENIIEPFVTFLIVLQRCSYKFVFRPYTKKYGADGVPFCIILCIMNIDIGYSHKYCVKYSNKYTNCLSIFDHFLIVSTKCPHQEIWWNFGLLRSEAYFSRNLFILPNIYLKILKLETRTLTRNVTLSM